jgi:hypothetical protein
MTEKELQVIDAEVVITPMTLIQQAQAGNASIEQMQQLFDLQLRWEANEAKKSFNKAMSLFKSECPVIPKNSKGQSGKFAGLADIAKVADPLLAKHGLSYRWEQSQNGDTKELTVTCVVTHVDGHSVSSPLTGPLDTSGNKNAIQSIGSSSTYLFRYSLNAALGLASSEMEDDGNATTEEPVKVIDECQLADLEALMDEVTANHQGFLAAYQIVSLATLPASMYAHAVKSLEAKRK